MAYQGDIQGEFFKRLAARKRSYSVRPSLDEKAVVAMHEAISTFILAQENKHHTGMRNAAMDLSVSAMLIVYSLDDALI